MNFRLFSFLQVPFFLGVLFLLASCGGDHGSPADNILPPAKTTPKVENADRPQVPVPAPAPLVVPTPVIPALKNLPAITFEKKAAHVNEKLHFNVSEGLPPYVNSAFGEGVEFFPKENAFKSSKAGWVTVLTTDKEGRSSQSIVEVVPPVQSFLAQIAEILRLPEIPVERFSDSRDGDRSDLGFKEVGAFGIKGGLAPYTAEIESGAKDIEIQIVEVGGSYGGILRTGTTSGPIKIRVKDSIGGSTLVTYKGKEEINVCSYIGDVQLGYGVFGFQRFDWKSILNGNGLEMPEAFSVLPSQTFVFGFILRSSLQSRGDQVIIVKTNEKGEKVKSFGLEGNFRLETKNPLRNVRDLRIQKLKDDGVLIAFSSGDDDDTQINLFKLNQQGVQDLQFASAGMLEYSEPRVHGASYLLATTSEEDRIPSDIPIVSIFQREEDSQGLKGPPSLKTIRFELDGKRGSEAEIKVLDGIPVPRSKIEDAFLLNDGEILVQGSANEEVRSDLERPDFVKEEKIGFLFLIQKNGILDKRLANSGFLLADLSTSVLSPFTGDKDTLKSFAVSTKLYRVTDFPQGIILFSGPIKKPDDTHPALFEFNIGYGSGPDPVYFRHYLPLEKFNLLESPKAARKSWVDYVSRSNPFVFQGSTGYFLTDLGVLKIYYDAASTWKE